MNVVDKTALVSVEVAVSDVITLSEGTTKQELLASRITQIEVRKRLFEVASALSRISDKTRSTFSELDYAGWRDVCARLEAGGDGASDALWFAVQALVPATLDWIRVYQTERPDWFA